MEHIVIAIIAVFFAGLGVVCYLQPGIVARYYRHAPPNADMRNEIRSLYGGLCIAFAAAGFAAFWLGHLVLPVLFCYGLSLLGMAAGRLGSLVLERTSIKPIIFLALELVLGSVSLYLFAAHT